MPIHSRTTCPDQEVYPCAEGRANHAMTISRADPQRLYAWNVSGRIGLYRSCDSGRTWEYLGDRVPGRVFYSTVYPAKGNVVFAGTDRGLLVSEDGGMSWRGYLSADTLNVPVTAVEFHPTNPEIVYRHLLRLSQSIDHPPLRAAGLRARAGRFPPPLDGSPATADAAGDLLLRHAKPPAQRPHPDSPRLSQHVRLCQDSHRRHTSKNTVSNDARDA